MKEETKLLVFTTSVIFLHIGYLAIFFGIVLIDETYLRALSTIIQLVVCIFLIIRFSPLLKNHDITKFDASIIFYCATFLLLNVVLVEVYNYLSNVKNLF